MVHLLAELLLLGRQDFSLEAMFKCMLLVSEILERLNGDAILA